MKEAREEIKATVTVNTSDLSSKVHESADSGRDNDKTSKKGQGLNSHLNNCFFGYNVRGSCYLLTFTGNLKKKLVHFVSGVDK